MKLKMPPNSLFAILLRNPWWISFLLAAVISVICAALLPKELVVFGVLGTIPFLVTGSVALKRQWNAPSAAALEAEMARLAALPWAVFAKELEAKFEKQGYAVARLNGKAAEGADYLLTKAGQTTLVAAKRFKAANHGLDALQALVVRQNALGANKAMYVCLGQLSEPAAAYAREKGLTVGLAA